MLSKNTSGIQPPAPRQFSHKVYSDNYSGWERGSPVSLPPPLGKS